MEQVRVWLSSPLIHRLLADNADVAGLIAVRRQRNREPHRRTTRNAL